MHECGIVVPEASGIEGPEKDKTIFDQITEYIFSLRPQEKGRSFLM